VNPTSAGLPEFAAYQTSVFWHQAIEGRSRRRLRKRAIDWMAQRRSARVMVRPDGSPGSGIAETPQQVGRIDRAAVDISRQRREVFARKDATASATEPREDRALRPLPDAIQLLNSSDSPNQAAKQRLRRPHARDF